VHRSLHRCLYGAGHRREATQHALLKVQRRRLVSKEMRLGREKVREKSSLEKETYLLLVVGLTTLAHPLLLVPHAHCKDAICHTNVRL
jgi:hypothetical protein